MSKIKVEVDAEKLNTIRRQISYKLNTDLTNEEALEYLLNSNSTRPKTFQPHYKGGQDAVLELIKNGSTSGDALRTLGCSRSTFFRVKAKQKNQVEE